MVCYNITAYNIKVKFVLRNNKENVICNNKNDEGEMQMKCSKNLERAIVLGLILSTSVYGTAWAEERYVNGKYTDENSIEITANSTVSPDTLINFDGEKKSLNDLTDVENVVIKFNPVEKYDNGEYGDKRAMGVYSARYELQGKNITVHVGSEDNPSNIINNDGLHLSNHYPSFYVRSYTAYIYALNSDALNLSHDITSTNDGANMTFIGNPDEEYDRTGEGNGNGTLTAVVMDGNGIRANASVNLNMISGITINGATNIELKGSSVEAEVLMDGEDIGKMLGDSEIMGIKVSDAIESARISSEYNPAAIYAGNDMYNFDLGKLMENYLDQENLKGTLEDMGMWDNVNELLSGLSEKNMGRATIGEGNVVLEGNTSLILNGNNNYGVYAGKNGNIKVNGNLNIQSIGNDSYGIAAQNTNLIYGDKLNANIYLTDEAKEQITEKVKEKLGPFGFLAESLVDELLNKTLEKEGGMDIAGVLDETQNTHGTFITLGNNTNVVIEMQGDNSKAIYASGIDDSAEQNQNSVSGKNLNSLWVKGDIVAEDGGLIELHVTGNAEDVVNGIDGNILAQGKGVNSETAAYSAKANSSKNATVNLTVDGELSGQGTLAAANGGTVNVVLGDRSNWAGRADDYQDAGSANWDHTQIENAFGKDTVINNSGTVNMTLGNEAFWNVTGQSWITNLTGDNSIIILDGDNTGGHALHIGDVNGSNTFVMNVRPDETGDMLYVKNGTGDTQHLVINNANEVLENMVKGDAVRFATIKNSGGGFNDDSNISDDSVLPKNNVQTFGSNTRISDAGMFNVDFDIVYNDYDKEMYGDLAAKDENSTVEEINDVYNGNGFDTNKPGSNYVDEVYGGNTDDTTTNSIAEADEESNPVNAYIVRKSVTKDNLSDAGKTIINMSRANYKNAIYMDRLNKRLGEVRYINGEEEQGMWVRLRHDRIGMDGEFRSQNTMYELGYDVKQECDNGERRLGFAVDYMDGSTTYSDIIGKGETKRYGLWLYDTWLGDKGHYADYVLKWGHLQNDFDIKSKTRFEDISGDYSNNVFSVSAEYGKKNDMGNNWYFEPQAQLQLARVTGAEYESTQNTKVSVDGINSLIGRAGFRLGRDLNENSTVYVKADLLHEFLGDQTITASDPTGTFRETFENKGTWYDVGFGFATAVGKNSYAFMDFEKSFGNDNDETYQINAGVQWTF